MLLVCYCVLLDAASGTVGARKHQLEKPPLSVFKQAAYICPVFHWSAKQVVQPQTHATGSATVINVLLNGMVKQTEQCFDSATVFTLFRENQTKALNLR